MVKCIAYRGGYKYQLRSDCVVAIPLRPPAPIDTEYIDLTTEGQLTIRKGYAWDGPSGPTIDTKNFMRGSLVHDALYQLMRENRLDRRIHRETADRILQSMCKEDGMSSLRAWWVYEAVRRFGDPAANPAEDKPVVYAPDGCQR
ncbi:conserved hypothetical protein [Rubrivivax sp. A210]|uniref:DUF1353 domain-containing protein n=1 Tax=Rubrivivax sp. A210 TaxID=2772301 RepID=UPI00191A9F96|nr:DUF1353 domain-containing protein [Rubrivivax sp. A210]CAD5373489.1 conserved hypothetical protein [Rubrivivax sp. A210]